jgi:glucosamine kinase
MTPASILPLHARIGRPPASARWLVGVDGGGSGTRLSLCDRDGRERARAQAGPSALGQGVEAAWMQIDLALQRAAREAGLGDLDWRDCALGAGLSGAGVPAQAEAFVARAEGACAALALDSDGFAAVLGAHGGQPGCVLIAGTGSVCEAWRADGSRRTVGAWGWIIGDEGSGAWLGKQALKTWQHVLDGRATAGVLARAVAGAIGGDMNAVAAWTAGAGQRELAALAPLVFACEAQDPAAADLLGRAVEALVALAEAADPEGTLPIALAGSVAQRLAPRLSPRLSPRPPRHGPASASVSMSVSASASASGSARVDSPRCVPAQHDAASGAVLLVRHLLAQGTTE